MHSARFIIDVLLAGGLGFGIFASPSAAAFAQGRSGTLRGTILDAQTGLPLACTVRIVDAEGRIVTESESFAEGFRCPGEFAERVPAGPVRVRVWRGFEFKAEERSVEVPADGAQEVRIRLERVVDMRKRGWYAGDSHIHMLHGEKTVPVTFDLVARSAQAEDLQYMSLAQAWTLAQPTPENLQAELASRSVPDCVLTWNLEAPKNYFRGDAGRCLGHCWILGLSGRTPSGDDAIQWLQRASAHDYESDKPSFANFESHRFIHSQGGAVFYSHPARWWAGAWGGQGGYPRRERMRISNLAVELPLDTLLGPTYDGLDVMTGAGEFAANAMAFDLWCLLLNHGYRVAATASSDSCFDRPGGATPGVVRTYTYVDGGFSLPAVARATAAGRTFATSGPLLLVSLAGQPPGTAFPADGTAREMRIEAWASGADGKGLTRLEVLRNGAPVRTNRFSPAVPSFATDFVVSDREPGWYCVRVFGGDAQRQRAISGAFFLDATTYQRPAPVPAQVHVTVLDRATGQRLSASVTEVDFQGPRPVDGSTHRLSQGEQTLRVPGWTRLRVEAAGYRPQTLSPFLDNPELVGCITGLSAEDLLKWETFERVQALLGKVDLTFRLERSP